MLGNRNRIRIRIATLIRRALAEVCTVSVLLVSYVAESSRLDLHESDSRVHIFWTETSTEWTRLHHWIDDNAGFRLQCIHLDCFDSMNHVFLLSAINIVQLQTYANGLH